MFYRVIAMFKTLNTEFLSNQMFHFLMKWIENFSKTKQQRPRYSHYYGNFNYFSHITLANGMILKHAPTKFKWPKITVEWVCLAHKWCHEQHTEQLALVSRSLSPSISLLLFSTVPSNTPICYCIYEYIYPWLFAHAMFAPKRRFTSVMFSWIHTTECLTKATAKVAVTLYIVLWSVDGSKWNTHWIDSYTT